MAKLNLPTLTGGYNDANLINEAFTAIEQFSDNTVSRDGATPNTMEAALDMNGQRIINLPFAQGPNEPLTFGQAAAYATAMVLQRFERQQTQPFEATYTFNTITYAPGVGNLALYRNGARLLPGVDYTEDSDDTITLTVTPTGIQNLDAYTNEYLGSVDVTGAPVSWANITGVPNFASRWPTYDEVTGKPMTFAPSAHTHTKDDMSAAAGSVADGFRGVFVQASTPTATRVGDLWIY